MAVPADAFLCSVHPEMPTDPLVTQFWRGATFQDLQEKGGGLCGDERLYVPTEDTGPSAAGADQSALS